MAYIDQDKKKIIAKALKQAFPNLKMSLSVKDYMTLTVKISSSEIFNEFLKKRKEDWEESEYYQDMNLPFNEAMYLRNGIELEHCNSELGKSLRDVIIKAGDWFLESDSQTDYFRTAFFFNIEVYPSK
ncbi:hypothetical protein UFOVP338_62 [uncultured Caudovirales phage]|uniref:Uncharacterized protein n=1 Tax=uncultured Caudovirales phage TaxID=2100421 RepID=A0A6J5M3J0_9CAUD|nr:hypothetical protein UFOVP338_62 [uncultured Caudovirales phage]